MKVLLVVLALAACNSSEHYAVTENLYFAKPGIADEVWRVRNHVCDVLVANGFQRGNVLRGPGGDGPDVIWQSAMYPSMDVLAEQGKKMVANPAVQEAMKEMEGKTRRFERRRYEVGTYDLEDDAAHPEPWGLVRP